jgi:hypothetical protein
MRKSWADQQGIKTGVMGEIVDGINITESNRATVYEDRREGIESLLNIARENYRKKGVNAVVFGVWYGADKLKYAVFVQNNFLKEVGAEI